VKIAQVSPLFESVPPKHYGGTERVVSYLTEALVAQGHEVTLYASGDSETRARLVASTPRSLRTDPGVIDSLAHHVRQLEQIARDAARFDIIHFHIDYLHFPWSRRERWPQVTTLHGRLDIADLPPLYDEFADMPVVSISNAQRQPLPHANWQGTVYHGLPEDALPFSAAPDGYLAFIGRISREKRVDRAIEIARQTQLPLRIAAKIDDADRAYFEREIRPLFDLPFVEYIGEIGEHEKAAFLGGARALLFPIDWAEPFGLVMIESMACGTPVVAWRRGSVPEVMTEGETGFVVSSMPEAVAAVRRIGTVDRAACRRVFEERFLASRMAEDYVRIYETIIRDGRADGRFGGQPSPNRRAS
jgi:glycosyltransferase involved in cell wall biosynthesis